MLPAACDHAGPAVHRPSRQVASRRAGRARPALLPPGQKSLKVVAGLKVPVAALPAASVMPAAGAKLRSPWPVPMLAQPVPLQDAPTVTVTTLPEAATVEEANDAVVLLLVT